MEKMDFCMEDSAEVQTPEKAAVMPTLVGQEDQTSQTDSKTSDDEMNFYVEESQVADIVQGENVSSDLPCEPLNNANTGGPEFYQGYDSK